MSIQKKLSSVQMSQTDFIKKGKILDLEKKYHDILWNIFSSNSFKHDLLTIENEIKSNYQFLKNQYFIKNKIKIPAERLARYHIYNPNLNNGLNILSIFPSPLSGDLAFITSDAVINIDIKTLDINGNRGDIGNLQYLPNQSSFKHKNVGIHPSFPNSSGVKVPSIMDAFYHGKPVLTYFLTIVYEDDPANNSFSISRNQLYNTIHFVNLPNGELSELFDFELLDNFKTYSYFKASSRFSPVLLLSNTNLQGANAEVTRRYSSDPRYSIFQMGTKTALLDLNNTHPTYGTNLTWVPVSRKNGSQYDFYLEAVSSGDTNRITEQKLSTRYDSSDAQWLGLKTIKY